MPKLKSKRSLLKRVKITKNKKILRSRAGRRHLLSGRAEGRKRHLRKKGLVSKRHTVLMRQALPYSF
jgi:large subunit ribosomal protein L35